MMSDSKGQTDSTQEVATNFHILTPYPGTVLFKRLEAEGHILTYNWDQYDTAHVVFRPACMTVEELERGYVWIYKKFYSWANGACSVQARILRFFNARPRTR